MRCVAPELDDLAGSCRDRLGHPTWEVPEEDLELVAIEDSGSVVLCPWHFQGLKAGRNWATSHRPLLRAYLRRKAGAKVQPIYDDPPQLSSEDYPADENPVWAPEARP
jgi:hypothetical protein